MGQIWWKVAKRALVTRTREDGQQCLFIFMCCMLRSRSQEPLHIKPVLNSPTIRTKSPISRVLPFCCRFPKCRVCVSLQLEQTNNLILRLNEQKMMLENQRATVEVVQSMHNAASAAKETMQALNVDHVDDLLANIGEQNDEMLAVQEALAQPTAMADMDDGELADELELLEQEVLDEELLAPAPVPATAKVEDAVGNLPAAPKTSKVEDELADLEAELAA